MEFKDIVVDNDAIVNTEPKELPKEAHDIPQGVKPQLNPNPGYGEDGKTVPAIKTDLVEGERGTPVDVVTEPRAAFKTVQEVYNFLNGIKIKGKSLEEYIDSQGGVTEEELQAAVAPKLDGKTYKVNTSITNLTASMLDALEVGDVVNVLESETSTTRWIVSVANGSASSYKNVDLFNVKVDSSGGPEKYYLTVYHFHRNNGATTYTNSHIQYDLQNIVANQTLVGGEQDLTSILIGYDRYKIPGGTKLYKHEIVLANTPYPFKINIISSIGDVLTLGELCQLTRGGITPQGTFIPYIFQVCFSGGYLKIWANTENTQLSVYAVAYSESGGALVETLTDPHPAGHSFTSIVSDRVTEL